MGRQRNNPQMKGKEESSETVLNEIDASQLSNIEFKTMVVRKLNELSENYQTWQESYKELTEYYISMKKDMETISKGQEEMKNMRVHLPIQDFMFLNRGRQPVKFAERLVKVG